MSVSPDGKSQTSPNGVGHFPSIPSAQTSAGRNVDVPKDVEGKPVCIKHHRGECAGDVCPHGYSHKPLAQDQAQLFELSFVRRALGSKSDAGLDEMLLRSGVQGDELPITREKEVAAVLRAYNEWAAKAYGGSSDVAKARSMVVQPPGTVYERHMFKEGVSDEQLAHIAHELAWAHPTGCWGETAASSDDVNVHTGTLLQALHEQPSAGVPLEKGLVMSHDDFVACTSIGGGSGGGSGSGSGSVAARVLETQTADAEVPGFCSVAAFFNRLAQGGC
eukprot:g5790.t1